VFQVPSSLASLLSLLAPCFTQPSFQTFSMLVVGTVGRVRDCTVTGMLQAAGLVGVWHHSRAHDFFARRRWDPDELGLWLLEFLVTVFVKADAPLRFGGARTTSTMAPSPKGREADYAQRVGAQDFEMMCWTLQHLLDDLNGAPVRGANEARGIPRKPSRTNEAE
jgi:hypothetical protein